jgi:3-hydroxyisobutyrate dehydrogenase-like beta-hydroxyacid dehydrogenase
MALRHNEGTQKLEEIEMPIPQKSPRIGVIGLGHMGSAFAANLVADGHDVRVHDRSHERMDALVSAGAKAAPQIQDLADCDIVLTSLPDDDVLSSIVLAPEGLLSVLRAGATHLSMSTISPLMSERLATAHATKHQQYVAAPVLGNPDLARARQLFVIAAGPSEAVATVRSVLERLGQRLFVVGEHAPAANLLKLAGNVLTATTLQALGEVLALLQKLGMDPRVGFDVLTNSLFDSRVHKTYGGKIIDGRYRPAGMAVPLAVKDLRLALAEAERAAVPMPAAALTHDRLVAMVARGWSDLDWSALGLLAASDAGLR